MSFKNNGRVICKEIELFGWIGYVPDEYNYITVDDNTSIFAWKEKPEYLMGFWDKGGSFMLVGNILEGWPESIDFEECLFELK